jgi:hypothetical protein
LAAFAPGFSTQVILPFDLRPENEQGGGDFEQALTAAFADGLDVVVDYFWGSSARTIG